MAMAMSNITYNTGERIGGKYDAFCKILLRTQREYHCHYCFKRWPKNSMIVCEKCHATNYCNVRCRLFHAFLVHAMECTNSVYLYSCEMDKTDFHWEVVAIYFALHIKRNKTAPSKGEDDPKRHQRYNLLDGTKRSFWQLPQDPKWKVDEEAVRVCNDLNGFLRLMGYVFIPDRFLEIFTIFRSNCLPIIEDGVHVGYILFPEISGFRHSCQPNAHWHLDNWQLQIRAIQPINSETIPTISYVIFCYEDIENLQDLPRLLKRECDDQCDSDRCNWASSNQDRYREMLLNYRDLASYFKTRPWEATWGKVKPMHENVMEILRLLFSENDHPITMHLVGMTILAKRRFDPILYEEFKKMANDRVIVMAGVDSDLYRSIN